MGSCQCSSAWGWTGPCGPSTRGSRPELAFAYLDDVYLVVRAARAREMFEFASSPKMDRPYLSKVCRLLQLNTLGCMLVMSHDVSIWDPERHVSETFVLEVLEGLSPPTLSARGALPYST